MDKISTERTEEALVGLLASFRKETCYHDNFEEEFLRNFHLRKDAEQATQSTWKLLLERLDNYLQNFRGWQWVYASMSIVTLAAVGVIIASSDMEPADNYVSSSDKEEMVLEQAIPVSSIEIKEEKPAADAPVETTKFTTEAPAYDTSAKDNQLHTDSGTDDKPVSRVLIEM